MAIIEDYVEGSSDEGDVENQAQTASKAKLELTDAERLHLLSTHGPLKPSALPAGNGSGKEPLIVINSEELARIANGEKVEWADDEDAGAREEVDVPLWEELLNDLLWTIPFGFLYTLMDYVVHAQFGQKFKMANELRRLSSIVPSIYLLTFVTMRPQPLFPPLLLQGLLVALCLAAGINLIHVTTREAYVTVIKQAPALGVIWVWCVVRLDLTWAVLGLCGVAAGSWYRGEIAGAKWW